MGSICESLCVLILICHNNGIKSKQECLSLCEKLLKISVIENKTFEIGTVRRQIVLDIDTGRQDTVMISPMKRFENEPEIQPDPLLEINCLCAALSSLIVGCHYNKIKDKRKSLKTCLSHLEEGTSDNSYKTRMVE
jgi:sporulation protein YlmC with PRC-barrel domain